MEMARFLMADKYLETRLKGIRGSSRKKKVIGVVVYVVCIQFLEVLASSSVECFTLY